jgi:hypothetical protein
MIEYSSNKDLTIITKDSIQTTTGYYVLAVIGRFWQCQMLWIPTHVALTPLLPGTRVREQPRRHLSAVSRRLTPSRTLFDWQIRDLSISEGLGKHAASQRVLYRITKQVSI